MTLASLAHEPSDDEKILTIGAVCASLKEDFPSISISKLRYLEDQKLINPKRTPGGYRLYSPRDVERLRTILRLQRDEFLPLRVIRQELETSQSGSFSVAEQAKKMKRAQLTEPAPTRRFTAGEVMEATGAAADLMRQLGEYGLIDADGGLDETQRELVQTAVELASYGVEPRHMRMFRTAAEREAALLEQLLSSGLRSRNPERRREALESMEGLAAIVSHIRHLALIAELRRIVA
ncbi:MAG: MerR family transcriptional regulator [Thermoleophilia bacterium]|nr:MerR family transcriptional regulator [Thermoleophilia bacterium]